MPLLITLILICAALKGIQSVYTVTHVAVEIGDTLQIPCQYESHYTNHVKYLCRGYAWGSCDYVIRTDQRDSVKYSISDDKSQRIVTFTFKNLQLGDADHYWCNIEIRSGRDDGERFQLSVNDKGKSKLHVDSQWVTGYFGDEVTIYVRYSGSGFKQWCRFDGTCIFNTGHINEAWVTTNTSVPGVFAVTMSGLQQGNIGWYWALFQGLQMPVFLDVTERPTTTTIATTPALSTATTESTSDSSSVTTEQRRVSVVIKAAAIVLGSLIFIVAASLVVCYWLKKHTKKSEEEQRSPEESTDVPVYSNICKAPKPQQNPCVDKDTEILYSSVSFVPNQASRKVNAKEEDVVYSTLAPR